MTAKNAPLIYLASPVLADVKDFGPLLAGLLDNHPVSCFRFRTGSANEAEICAAAEHLRDLCHAREVPIVIETHFRLVTRLGLDGVHLLNAAKSVREARKAVGKQQIVGAYCGASQHAGMTAAELGCDYVEFGPAGMRGLLGDGKRAGPELFQWWHQMIEVPVVAEGGITPETAADLAPFTDFLCLGDELWSHPEGPDRALSLILTLLQ